MSSNEEIEEYKDVEAIKIYEKYKDKPEAFKIPGCIIIDKEDISKLNANQLYNLSEVSSTDFVLTKHAGFIEVLRYDNELEEKETWTIPEDYGNDAHSFGSGLYVLNIENSFDYYIEPERDLYLIKYTGEYYKCQTEAKRDEILIQSDNTVEIVEKVETEERLNKILELA